MPKKKIYTEEFKRRCVQRAKRDGKKSASDHLGVPISTLKDWCADGRKVDLGPPVDEHTEARIRSCLIDGMPVGGICRRFGVTAARVRRIRGICCQGCEASEEYTKSVISLGGIALAIISCEQFEGMKREDMIEELCYHALMVGYEEDEAASATGMDASDVLRAELRGRKRRGFHGMDDGSGTWWGRLSRELLRVAKRSDRGRGK